MAPRTTIAAAPVGSSDAANEARFRCRVRADASWRRDVTSDEAYEQRTSASSGSSAEVESASESGEAYLGFVKSYNARRGFGFIACEATAAKFGRDVYIGKADAQKIRFPPTTESQKLQVLAEEDFVSFSVRMSAEGYPQATNMCVVAKLQGMIVEPPGEIGEFGEEAKHGRIVSDELAAICGKGVREAHVKRANCGCARFAAGDRVHFCVWEDGDNSMESGRPQVPEGLLVMLAPRPQSLGSILGCGVLLLPRTPVVSDVGRPILELDCHALGDRIILSGLPEDVDQAELMRFFAKHGATGASVAARPASAENISGNAAFAAVAFPSASEVARFVSRSIHTFADDKDARLARVLPHRRCADNGAKGKPRLPGLPAPGILPSGSDGGGLTLSWSPVVLATRYLVELRPAGVQAAWAAVDASNGKWGGGAAACFSKDCSSCIVVGLPTNVVFEARVTYITACGCYSDASDPSEWCVACPSACPLPNPTSVAAQFAAQVSPGISFHSMGTGLASWPQAAVCLDPMPTLAAPQHASHLQPLPQQLQQHRQPTAGFWRCVHGSVVLPPALPELRFADDYGFALLAQWASVANAAAYIVELCEVGAQRAPERFVRPAPPMSAVIAGSLVELSIGGLRPTGVGQRYVAQVRSVGICGCESEPSPAAVCFGPPAALMQHSFAPQQVLLSSEVAVAPHYQPMHLQMQMPLHMLHQQPQPQMPPISQQPTSAQQQPHQRQPHQLLVPKISLAEATAPPTRLPHVAPSCGIPSAPLPLTATMPTATFTAHTRESEKLKSWQMQAPSPTQATGALSKLPSLLQSGRAPSPLHEPLDTCTFGITPPVKEAIVPMAANDEEECILLD